jgi:hypothetical protein
MNKLNGWVPEVEFSRMVPLVPLVSVNLVILNLVG